MIQTPTTRGPDRLTILLETAIAEYGTWRVLGSAARAALSRRKRPPPDVEALSAHLRRDIGLPPPSPRPKSRGLGYF